jgi:outer membrane protein assembly factor BamB
MTTQIQTMAASPSRPRKMRWWMPAIISVVALAFLTWFQLNETMTSGFRFSFSLLVGLAAGALLTIWYIFFTGLRWRTRFALVALCAALLTAWYLGVRMDGVTGDMHIQLRWAWTTPRHLTMTAPEVDPATAQKPVDLSGSTDDFPQFLGRNRQAVVTGVRLARDWSAHPPRELWRTEVGAGWSAFAVAGSLAITQEQRGEQEITVCRDKTTGAVRWTRSNTARFSEKMGGDGPRATPTIADGRVYVLGATGILECLDAATGKAYWSFNALGQAKDDNLVWGKSTSPLLVDDLVVISLGKSNEGSLAAYEKSTGKLRWRAGEDEASYCSPVLVTLAGQRQIVMVNAHSVTGHEPTSGRVLWKYGWTDDMPKASQPVPLPGDRLLLTCGYGVADVLLQIKCDSSQKWSYEEKWSNSYLKTNFTTAVVRDGFAYGLDDGVLACIDLETGDRRWKAGRYGHGQVLLVEDVLIVQGEGGTLFLVEATPEGHHELGKLGALTSKTWNNPALAGRLLLVRNDREAVCYQLTVEELEDSLKRAGKGPIRDDSEKHP